jgi:hypothetical protein
MHNEDSDIFVGWKAWMNLGPWVSAMSPPPLFLQPQGAPMYTETPSLDTLCGGGGGGGGEGKHFRSLPTSNNNL